MNPPRFNPRRLLAGTAALALMALVAPATYAQARLLMARWARRSSRRASVGTEGVRPRAPAP